MYAGHIHARMAAWSSSRAIDALVLSRDRSALAVAERVSPRFMAKPDPSALARLR